MCREISPITLLVFSLVFQTGNGAVSRCPGSPVNTAIYFDLEQLGHMALQHGYNDIIYSPILCEGGNDSECSKQQCCYDEVGCCYTDPNSQVKKCGCKQLGSETCTYSAPLAILAKTECDTDKITDTKVCLRERRADDDKHDGTRNANLQTNVKANRIGITTFFTGPLVLTKRVVRVVTPFREALGDKASSAGLLDQRSKCPMPTNSSLIYFDLKQLSLITLQQGLNGEIQTPRICVEEHGGDCSQQQCCHGEVGCCYTDQNKHIRKCGCRRPKDKTCTFSAPLAILANSQCENKQVRNTSACFRERRWNEASVISTKTVVTSAYKVYIDVEDTEWTVL